MLIHNCTKHIQIVHVVLKTADLNELLVNYNPFLCTKKTKGLVARKHSWVTKKVLDYN